jgi:maleate cis-trans isomerase
MTHRFGVLVPPTNTTAEDDYRRLLPSSLQALIGRVPLLHPGDSLDELDAQAGILARSGVES